MILPARRYLWRGENNGGVGEVRVMVDKVRRGVWQ